MNLAAQLGASRIVLLGYDMSDDNGHNWHERSVCKEQGRIPTKDHYKKFRKAIQRVANRLKAMHIEVINCSPDSALTCFPRMTFERAMTIIEEDAEKWL